jgi:hypothetical protein
MVLKGYIKIIAVIFTFIIIVLFFSCEKTGLLVDCSECKSQEPTEATLKVQLSTQYGKTDIDIYEGNLEDSVLFYSLSTYAASKVSITVPINKKYTLTAKYIYNQNVYVAVNSVTPRVKYSKDQCDDPCYYIYNYEVDLRLKYTK